MSSGGELRCHHCTELIGVYEPMILVRDGVPVRTSGAAAEVTPVGGEPCFHEECFTSTSDPGGEGQ